MQKRVYILGGYQSDFSQNWHRNELDLLDIFQETITHGLTSVDIEPKEIVKHEERTLQYSEL